MASFDDRNDKLPFKVEIRSKTNKTDKNINQSSNMQNAQKIKQQEVKTQEVQSSLDSLKKTLTEGTKSYFNPLQHSLIKKNLEEEKKKQLEAQKKEQLISQQIYNDYKKRNINQGAPRRDSYGFNKRVGSSTTPSGSGEGKRTLVAPKFIRNVRPASGAIQQGQNGYNRPNFVAGAGGERTFTPKTYDKTSKPPFAKTFARTDRPDNRKPGQSMNIFSSGLARQMLNSTAASVRSGGQNSTSYQKKKPMDLSKEKKNNKPLKDRRGDTFDWRRYVDSDDMLTANHKGKKTKAKKSTIKKMTTITLNTAVSMVDLSQLVSIPIDTLMANAKSLGVYVNNTQDILDNSLVALILEMNHINCNFYGSEEQFKDYIKIEEASCDSSRPPVICVLGHVDHGKTSLLDCIKKTKVVELEAGGITQNISLYQLKEYGNSIFIDTPGHSVFSTMRKVGILLTDIVILIIAADDGIQDQTREIIEVLKHYQKKIIICITKIDKVDNFNPSKIYNELTTNYEIVPEEYGGDVPVVRVSNRTGEGIKELLETIYKTKDVLNLKYNSKRAAIGTVVNSYVEKGFGIVTYILLKQGILKVGDEFVSGKTSGKVRFIFTPNSVKTCSPNDIIKVVGFEDLAVSGDDFVVVENNKLKQEIIDLRKNGMLEAQKESDGNLLTNLGKKKISILLKADTVASLSSLSDALKKLSNDQVIISIFSQGIGPITDSDLQKALEFDLCIVAFNVKVPREFNEKIKVISSNIIYHILDEVVDITKQKKKVKKEELVGTGEVIELFKFDKIVIAGSKITSGSIFHSDDYVCEIFRNNKSIFKGHINSMKRTNNRIREAKNGTEVGIVFENFNNIELKDQIKCYKIVEEMVVIEGPEG